MFNIKTSCEFGLDTTIATELFLNTQQSCCHAVKISSNKKKFDSKSLIDSSPLCRGEPVVGKGGMLNIQLVKGVRDIKGRMCKVQLGFYAVSDTNYPYLSVGDEPDNSANHDQGLFF